MSQLGKRPRSQSQQLALVPARSRAPRVRLMKTRRVAQKSKSFAPEIKHQTGSLLETSLFMNNSEQVDSSFPSQWKFVDCVYTNFLSQTPQLQKVLNGLNHGTNAYERVGRKIKLQKLQLRLEFISRWQRDVKIRYVVVQKKDFNRTDPSDLTLIENNPYYQRGNTPTINTVGSAYPDNQGGNNMNGIRAFKNLLTSQDFKILLDRTVTLKQSWNINSAPIGDNQWANNVRPDPDPYGAIEAGGVAAGVPYARMYKTHVLDLKDLVVKYTDTAPTTRDSYGQVETNGIYVIACVDNAPTDLAGGPQPGTDPWQQAVLARGNFRMSYYD
jgi:hypothetical protein